MSDLSHALSKKVGPFPAGVWAAVIAGGVGVAYVIRGRSTPAAAPDQADPGDVLDSYTGGTGGADYSAPGSSSAPAPADPYAGDYADPFDPYAGGDPVTDAGAVSDNYTWRQQAIKALTAGGMGALAAEIAVTKYLSGAPLSQADAAAINAAAASIGPAPEPVPLPSLAATPPKPHHEPKHGRNPKPQPPKGHAHPKPHPKPDPKRHGHNDDHPTAGHHAAPHHNGPHRRDTGKGRHHG